MTVRSAEESELADVAAQPRPHSLGFFVAGVPQTQGSYRAFRHQHTGKIILTSDNKKLRPWRRAIKTAARAAAGPVIGSDPLPSSVAVGVSLVFVFERPAKHRSLGLHTASRLLPSAPAAMVQGLSSRGRGPDLDKLTRALLDGLADGLVIADDRQVNRFLEPFAKEWADAGKWWGAVPGVHVRLEW